MNTSKCTTCVWNTERTQGNLTVCTMVCEKGGGKKLSRQLCQYPKRNERDIIAMNRAAKRQGISYGRYVALGYLSVDRNGIHA